MAIKLLDETIIPVADVPKILGPVGRNGSRMSIGKVMRGVLEGLNGHKLEAVRCGSRWITSIESVERWLAAQAAGAMPADAKPARPGRSPGRIREAAARAARRLDELGI